ncbi:transcription factor ETV7 isoform X2 [Phyllopteryx taeniolatus]|uniref:transcription factor ETV7 isoform X2 n=1 Tax=Phyllopteryx taeniolatus TaxID=161469 RepID=UPI002AD238B9|nr:transcription factor ETV7 isoform X2 [Phyllopteryx taeniolatus]
MKCEDHQKRSSSTLMHGVPPRGHHNPAGELARFGPPTRDDLWHLPGELRINPFLWDKEDVSHWLHWAHKEYSLRRPEKGHFEMNGRALCLLTKEDFRYRSPSSGDVLYEILQCVIWQRSSLVCEPPKKSDPKTEESLPRSPDNTQAPEKQDETERLIEEPLNLSCQENPRRQMHKPDGRLPECRLLWNYVYKLLSDDQYQEYIRWEDRSSLLFRVVDPNGLAHLWGRYKNRDNMTYEKMSRALRHYYKLNIIKKERGQKFLFRFLKTPQEFRKELDDHVESPAHSPLQDRNFPDSSPLSNFREEGFEVSPDRISPECFSSGPPVSEPWRRVSLCKIPPSFRFRVPSDIQPDSASLTAPSSRNCTV